MAYEMLEDEQRIGLLAKKLLTVLFNDIKEMAVFDRYLHGEHDPPYMPDTANDEYQLLADRCTMNWIPLIVDTPVQAMYVDGFQPGDGNAGATGNQAWDHWQRSGLDAKQSPIYRSAFTHGHAFTITDIDPSTGASRTRGLSPLRTSALFEDPANDITPAVAMTVHSWAEWDDEARKTVKLGKATLWDHENKYDIWFDTLSDASGAKVGWKFIGKHGCSTCPVTRFSASVDLEGRTTGLVGPMKPVQDRINQTIFDLLIAQTYGSFKVRWVTGMAPPLMQKPVFVRDEDGNTVLDTDGQPLIEGMVNVLDGSGRPMPNDVNLSPKRLVFAEDPEVRFGAIDGTPLDGYIKACEMAIRQLAALSQTPPHHILGQIANLSAEALEAAETSLQRKVQLFQTIFGECWERVFNLAAELDGDTAGALDYNGEVKWRDLEGAGLAKSADALLKLKELEVPRVGLWRRIPGATESELTDWQRIVEEDPAQVLSAAVRNAAAAEVARAEAEVQPNKDGDLVA